MKPRAMKKSSGMKRGGKMEPKKMMRGGMTGAGAMMKRGGKVKKRGGKASK